MDNCEFKIVRTSTGNFDRRPYLDKVLQEEARAGWQLVEKLDAKRTRLKRSASSREGDAGLPADYDPYRSRVGMTDAEMIALGVGGGLAVLVVVVFIVLVLKERPLPAPGPLVGGGGMPVADKPVTPAEEAKFQGRPTTFWIKQLEDKDPRYREMAAEALGAIGPDAKRPVRLVPGGVGRDPGAVVRLKECLKDPSENVRKAAAEAIKKIDPEAAAEVGTGADANG